jgi:peroxiredoxin
MSIAISLSLAVALTQSGAAPPIEGTTSANAKFKLSEAIKKGPVYVYFISTTCPVTASATKYFDRIAKGFNGKSVTFVGIVNDGKAGFDPWQREHKLSFSSILDPDYKVIEAYKITNAPSAALIGKDGKLVKTWSGWSKGYLQEQIGMIANLIKSASPAVNLAGAPASVEAG